MLQQRQHQIWTAILVPWCLVSGTLQALARSLNAPVKRLQIMAMYVVTN